MDVSRLQDHVERWLIHENYKFSNLKDDNVFTISIKHGGGFGNQIKVFQPPQLPTVLVLGSLVPLKNNQNARYLQLNDTQKQNFAKKVEDYCQTIKAINKMSLEDGKLVVGVFVVIDKEERFNQQDFIETMATVAEMGDKVNQFLLKTF